VEAEERAARRAVREHKLAILEQLFWATDFRREALAAANAELGTPTSCAALPCPLTSLETHTSEGYGVKPCGSDCSQDRCQASTYGAG